MKKVLLGILALASYAVSAQTYTVDDTLSAGDSQTYYALLFFGCKKHFSRRDFISRAV